MELDISSAESISNFADQFAKQHGKVDVLVNNAAFAFKSSDPFTFESGVSTFNTNYYGTMNFTNAMLPYLKQNGHIVVIGSRMGSLDWGVTKKKNR